MSFTPIRKIQGSRLAGFDFGDSFIGPALELVLGRSDCFIPTRLVFEDFKLLEKTLAERILCARRKLRRSLECLFQEFGHGAQDTSCAVKLVVG